MQRRRLYPAILLGLTLLAGSAWAGEKSDTYDRVTLSAGAEAEVPNDLLTTVAYMQLEGSSAAKLADGVNRAIGWAVEEAKKVQGVTVRTLDYRTSPVYTKQALTGWRVRQAIRLESRDPAALGQLIGKLQNRLSVETIGYRLSPERRREAENELIGEAIAAFNQRARQVTRQLDRKGYRLVEMDVNTGGVQPRPMLHRSASFEMRADAVRPPALEPGSQTVEVRVSGTIELRIQ